MRDGHHNVCKLCDNARRAKTKKRTVYTPEKRAANNVHVRRSVFKRKFNGQLSPEDYDDAVATLDSCCQLCDAPTFRMCVDFRDGVVKGLLCERCKRKVKRWVEVNLDEIAETTTDPVLHRYIEYFKNPPGIEELYVQQG